MKHFQIIALTLPGMPDPSIAIAASRAGGIGVLDLEYLNDREAALKSIQKLAKFAHNDFGLKLAAANAGAVVEMLPELPAHLKFALLSFHRPKALKDVMADLQRRGLSVWVECTHIDQALLAEKSGADGVIAKGHESGGRVGNETTFILLQKFMANLSVPVWVQGGIGQHTAAACYSAGAAGVILDFQLSLARESILPGDMQSSIARFDGSETLCLGEALGETYRMCTRFARSIVDELNRREKDLIKDGSVTSKSQSIWRREISQHVGQGNGKQDLFLCGQDITFAASLADRFVTVGGILEGIHRAVNVHCEGPTALQVLSENSALAKSHGTRYPIVQGPMARVSDNAAFVAAIAQNGALPFVAAAWMRSNELDTLLKKTGSLLDDLPWGVGLLGFLPAEVYREQIETIIRRKPPYALIAGGQPAQAKALEKEGIATYLHVPSAGLLRMFLDQGARRFVFEGRESGGHVGPLSSLVLWETIIPVLLEHLRSSAPSEAHHVLFAGGIHDAVSASMVAVIAATLQQHGIRVGFQLGSAYLFTEEAVGSGAIAKPYFDEAVASTSTTLLETGPGHVVRCLDNPFAESFKQEKRRLLLKKFSAEETHARLERMKLGRLRIASKGLAKNPEYDKQPFEPRLVALSEDEQREQGLYMIGQLAALRNKPSSIAELHHEIVIAGSKRLENLLQANQNIAVANPPQVRPLDVAIIGMACLLPKAPCVRRYWENILNKVSAIEEIPEERWDWRRYFSEDRQSTDTVYSKWGAFVDDITFDPVHFGMPPKSLPSIEPLQLLTLHVASKALEDAGYRRRSFPRERTAVILGISGVADLAHRYGFRAALPMFTDESADSIYSCLDTLLPEWTEDSFPGILANVTAGRIANRLDLGGSNFAVDGACASSLAAIYLAAKELQTNAADMVLVGGADAMQNPFTYLCFSNTQALSPRGICSPLDQNADGIVIGEGVAVAVLKRLKDAERDGDRIYAVIQGVGAASDGRDKSLTAPRPEGQIMALERAYHQAGYPPATVSLFEAHATGTTVGDAAEIESLSAVFDKYDTPPHTCAIGSVKSMIGHTKSTAGVASLIKAALSLHHKILPPTLGVEKPNEALRSPKSFLYVNSKARPWVHTESHHPRRAGVSAFGFGGTNFHVALEEYTGEYREHLNKSSLQRWPTELFLFSGPSRTNLLERIVSLQEALSAGINPDLAQLAYSFARLCAQNMSTSESSPPTLAIVATSPQDLKLKLNHAIKALQEAEPAVHDPRGIYYYQNPLPAKAKVAFLFPGQGSQYVNMFADLAIIFPEIQRDFARGNDLLKNRLDRALSTFVIPKPAFSDEERGSQHADLSQTHIAQPAMGMVNMAMLRLLESFGLKPDMVAGHSYGEYAALCAAGVISEADLIRLSEARARFIQQAAAPDPGTMAAVAADRAAVEDMIAKCEDVWIANHNAPNQTVITGTQSAVEAAVKEFNDGGIRARKISVNCAFHSPIISEAGEQLLEFLSGMSLGKPRIKIFSNTTARTYPAGPKAIARLLIKHLVQRVDFVSEIEAMYADGARVFVEVGAGRVLTGLVDQILQGQPHLALHSNSAGRPGIMQLQHLLGHLTAHGVSLNIQRLFQERDIEKYSLSTLLTRASAESISATTWLVNGSRAIPFKQMSEPNPDRKVVPLKLNLETGTRNRPAVQPVPPAACHGLQPLADNADRVLFRHQQLMQRFLEIQKSVMLNYLQGTAESDTPEHLTPDQKIQQPEMKIPSSDVGAPPPLPDEQSPASLDETAATPDFAGLPTDEPQPAEVTSASRPAEKGIVNREALTQKLLEIVSDRTGYPPDMLELDLDLEAELGIDSIKRVEILGHFLQFVFGSEHGELAEDLGDMNRFKTLRKIIDQAQKLQNSMGTDRSEKVSAAEPLEPSPPAAVRDHQKILPRFTNAVVEAAPPNPSLNLSSERVVLITDDGSGIAEALKQKLMRSGFKAAMIHFGEAPDKKKLPYYSLEDDFLKAVSEPFETIRERHGPLGGIVHLLPLRPCSRFEDLDMSGWRERMQLDVKTLFYLLKLSEDDLTRSAREGAGFVVSASAMGGHFACGSQADQGDFFPGHAAIPGLLKTVAVEWPEINVKCVDFNMQDSHSNLVDHLFAEIRSTDSIVEVGYDGSRRLFAGLAEASLMDRCEDKIQVDSDWVILITGGARGITAEVARQLAKSYRPTLILAGRSELPPEIESDVTRGLTDEKEMKSALIAAMKSRGESAELAQVRAAYEKICKERQIRANLDAMRRDGARVIYEPVDVRDEQQFGRLIDGLYESHGRLDGVIHGAGVIEDKRLADKSWESFDRVFGTKTDSVFVLSQKLQPGTLKFMALFSSVAGRFGNIGQCDYTAANDVMNKVAIYLDRRWAGRVFAVNWGPWSGGGMASENVQRQFRQRGVELIPPLQGARSFDLELRKGFKGESEIVLGEGPWRKAVEFTGGAALLNIDLPLLQQKLSMTRENGFVEIQRRLDSNQDLYLQDHRLDAKPVLPAAMAVELAAETSQLICPDWKVTAVRDLRVFKGIVLDDGAVDIRIMVRFDENNDRQAEELNLQVKIQNAHQPRLSHYGAGVVLRKTPPDALPFQQPSYDDLEPFHTSVPQTYQKWLFHGPRFQCIQHIDGISKSGMLATLAHSVPADCFSYGPQGQWLADPIVLDGGLQMALIWARIYLNITVLPSSIKAVHLHRPFHSAASIQCHLQVLETFNRQSVTYNMLFTDSEGELLGMIEKIEATGSEALNRLTESSPS